MNVKRLLRMVPIFFSAILITSCDNMDSVSEKEQHYDSDKYGCVMFCSIDNIEDSTKSIKNLKPGGVSKFVTPNIAEGTEGRTLGEIVNCEGKRDDIEISCAENEYLEAVGTYSNSNEIVVVREEREENDIHHVVEAVGKNEDFKQEIEIPEGYNLVESHSDVLIDPSGLVHIANVIRRDGESFKNSYIVFKDGKVVFQHDLTDKTGSYNLIVLPDCSVAVDINNCNVDGNLRHEVALYSGVDSSFDFVCEYSTTEELRDDEIIAINIFDEKHLVYATYKGIYLSDTDFENQELIFGWHKNGISIGYTLPSLADYKICANYNGDIFVLKEGFRCDEYLKLSKLPENITTIEIAGISGIRSYSQAVLDFNISHPESHIVIKDDYNKTNLLTRLIAGDGPEVVDAGVVDVRAQKKIWEPLSNLVPKTTIDSLNKGAIICGSIDGELFGVASSFWIDTLVTGETLTEWDYDTFLKTIENSSNIETITSNSLLQGKTSVFEALFCSGIDDTYFIDQNGKSKVVDKDKLEKIVSLIEQYQTQNNYDDRSFDMVADRSMLCVKYLVTRPTDLYSILYAFGDKGNIIGYPGKNGSKHFLYDSGTLFVRKNVAADKRKIISEFFEYLLSYEEQKRCLFSGLSDGFSARDDVLSEQIDAIKDIEGERAGLGNVMFTFKDIDTKAARNKIDEIMNRSVSYRDFSDSFYSIIEEEIGNYFAGSMGLDKLEDNLNKRIGIYIKERE